MIDRRLPTRGSPFAKQGFYHHRGRSMSLWHNIPEMMDYYLPPLPSMYWIDVSRRCNLRCVMCPQSRGLRPHPATMPLDRFQRILDDVCENHPLIKLYLSGEPLLHEALLDMIEYAHGKNCQTAIHTNGTLFTEELSERILSSSLTFLSFSFDGCTPEIYERLRPPARFEQVHANIRRFLDRRRQAGRGPYTNIEIIRMRDTEDFIPSFVDEWKAHGAEEVCVVDYMTWLGTMPDRRDGQALPLSAYTPCAAPFQHGCILSDGTVVPCCLDVDGRMPLGNVTEQPFHEIWIGNAFRQLRLRMLTGKLETGSICDACCNTRREAE
jgi:MoaA/NifB/PqqE/SkfB family radical SAM enzyme